MPEENATGNVVGDAQAKAAFDQNDPYPLLELNACTYREAQEHATLVDEWLGLKTHQTESTLAQSVSDQELWIGLPVTALLTPYIELRQMLNLLHLKSGDTVVDFGAAYGRMGFVIGAHYPKVRFLGYELVQERVTEGERCLRLKGYADSAQMICVNIDSPEFVLPEAEIYFIYDFSHRAAIDRLLLKLQDQAKRRLVTVVARGRSSRDAIDHGMPWLSQVVSPEHYQNFSIYRSATCE